MKNVTYINAGAGSGKTYTLTETLAKLIASKEVSPEQVILTTFTKKAANEFKEKAKSFLYKRGLYEEAIRLDQAMIGTIHSVAKNFINKYWFYLGLTPDMGAMEDEETKFYISQSLSDLATDAELRTLHSFCVIFNITYGYSSDPGAPKGISYDFWQADLKRIIEYTTNYGVTDYSHSIEKSCEFLQRLVDKNVLVEVTDAELQQLLSEARSYVNGSNSIKKKDDYHKAFDEIQRTSYKKTVAWYKNLSGTIKAKYGPTCASVAERLTKLWQSSVVYQPQEEYIKLLFTLAERWRDRFAAFKRERNLLDYNDMEEYMLQLMEIPELAEEIEKAFRFLFVDEYQDCSPIQVKIFDKLSDLMEHSYWVGDYKQAIYGFRGSDTALTKAVVDRISKGNNGCDTYPLTESYRSLPDIVDVCNDVFCKTFAGVLDKKNIALNKVRENKEKISSLRYFDVSGGAYTISDHIAKLIREGAKPNEIAVLCRTNKPLAEVAQILHDEYDIPSSRESLSIVGSRATILVESLLQLIENDKSTLAKAQIAYLTVEGYGTSKIIDDKLLFDSVQDNKEEDYLIEVPLIAKLLARKDDLKKQSLSAMVETMIIELDLFNEVKRWISPEFSESCLNTIISATIAYEEHCVKMNMPATINGFIGFVEEFAPAGMGDSKGVQLHTYHSSKGLQWKYVILMSLGNHPAEEKSCVKQEVYGVHFARVEEPSASNPYPEVFIRVLPWLYGSNWNSSAPAEIQELVVHTPEYDEAYKQTLAESNRLLYVGMTRPRDVLILAIEKAKNKSVSSLQWFKDMKLDLDDDWGKSQWDVFKSGIPFKNMTLTEAELNVLLQNNDVYVKLKFSRVPYTAEPCQAEARDASPSMIEGKGKVANCHNFKARIPVKLQNSKEMSDVGNCIHQIYAGIENHKADANYIKETISNHTLGATLSEPKAIEEAWIRLTSWLEDKFGKAEQTYHERPFKLLKDGHIYTGSIDFIWKTSNGIILIDFKTCPLGDKYILDEQSDHFAGLYAGQLDAYEDALKAAGEKVLKRLIYYPVSGLVVEVE